MHHTSLDNEITRTLLSLLHVEGIRPRTVRKIMSDSGPDASLILQEAKKVIPLDPSQEDSARAAADRDLDVCAALGIKVINAFQVAYPPLLSQIRDYPPIAFIKGDLSALSSPCVAVVGTRRSSEYGKQIADRVAYALASRGICVVSGLARGTDTAVHEAALRASGSTIAVLAHGLDQVYPKRNEELSRRIVESGGALVSELPPGVRLSRYEFVQRNRIQSGLSRASVIIESGKTGGSIHQAKFTVRQGRRLFVILPEQITSDNSDYDLSGSLWLMEELGAKALRTTGDLQRVIELFEDGSDSGTAQGELDFEP